MFLILTSTMLKAFNKASQCSQICKLHKLHVYIQVYVKTFQLCSCLFLPKFSMFRQIHSDILSPFSFQADFFLLTFQSPLRMKNDILKIQTFCKCQNQKLQNSSFFPLIRFFCADVCTNDTLIERQWLIFDLGPML